MIHSTLHLTSRRYHIHKSLRKSLVRFVVSTAWLVLSASSIGCIVTLVKRNYRCGTKIVTSWDNNFYFELAQWSCKKTHAHEKWDIIMHILHICDGVSENLYIMLNMTNNIYIHLIYALPNYFYSIFFLFLWLSYWHEVSFKLNTKKNF